MTTNLSAECEKLVQNIVTERKLSVDKHTWIRRFDDGTIGWVSTNWRILIDNGEDNVEIAAAIMRAYFCKVASPEDLDLARVRF